MGTRRLHTTLLLVAFIGAGSGCTSADVDEVRTATTTSSATPTSSTASTTSTTTSTTTTAPPLVQTPAPDARIPGDQIAFIESIAIAVFETNEGSEFNPAWFEAGDALRDAFAESKRAAAFLGWSNSTVQAISTTATSETFVTVEVELTTPRVAKFDSSSTSSGVKSAGR